MCGFFLLHSSLHFLCSRFSRSDKPLSALGPPAPRPGLHSNPYCGSVRLRLRFLRNEEVFRVLAAHCRTLFFWIIEWHCLIVCESVQGLVYLSTPTSVPMVDLKDRINKPRSLRGTPSYSFINKICFGGVVLTSITALAYAWVYFLIDRRFPLFRLWSDSPEHHFICN